MPGETRVKGAAATPTANLSEMNSRETGVGPRDAVTLDELRHADLPSLERLFVTAPVAPNPTRRLRGTTLMRIDSPRARSPLGRLLVLPFERLPFGVDFRTGRWFFVAPALQLGSFRAQIARSRWRETDVVALHYETSRLPRAIKGWLYDEVKPLAPDLCLGLGGIQTQSGDGDLFFFALHP
ncbi:MAG TPA: hypothetical protein PKA88_25310 [Polyangiaceae bacterium]|nr:hypothetical protein [Polyangiaceae bacterium]HMR77491.1 hypothetical protein [Polyangiaceae bacterium]